MGKKNKAERERESKREVFSNINKNISSDVIQMSSWPIFTLKQQFNITVMEFYNKT